jgi:hypothetical protein
MTNIEIFISGNTEFDAVLQLEAILDMIKIAQEKGDITDAGWRNSTDDVEFDFTVVQKYDNANEEIEELFPGTLEELNNLKIR